MICHFPMVSHGIPKKKYPLPKFDVCHKIPWSRDIMTTAPRQSKTFHVLQEALEAGHTRETLIPLGDSITSYLEHKKSLSNHLVSIFLFTDQFSS